LAEAAGRGGETQPAAVVFFTVLPGADKAPEGKMADPLRPDETPPPQPERQGAGTAPEQRAHVRYYYYARRPAAPYGLGGAVCEGEARLHDISRGGFALLAHRGLNPGTVLFVRLPTADPDVTLTQLAQVVRVRRLGPLSWFIGCAFLSRLDEREAERVVGKPDLSHRATN
jgi:hypothetical protein